jgi:transposase
LLVKANEYNTSQVCSACFQAIKLCDVGSQRDPFITRPTPVAKKIRTNITYQTIWNRDTNAARNMIFLALHKVYGVD